MDHDPSFDRLLRQTLRDDDATAGACLDAETLAAWSEGTLSHAERDAAERHAADCTRCLATLAAMDQAASATVPPSSSQSAWSRWFSVRWLAPAAAAVAAVAIWIAVDRQATAPNPEQQRAEVDLSARSEAPASASAPAAPPPSAKAEAAAARAFGTSAGAPAIAQPQRQAAARDTRARADSVDAQPAEKPGVEPLPPIPEVAVIPRPSAPPTPVAEHRPAANAEASRVMTDAAKAAPGTTPRQEKVSSVAEGMAPRVVTAEGLAAASARAAGRGGGERSEFAPIVTTVSTPDPAIRWRFAGRMIERSIDSGASWRPQTVSAPGTIVAGSCPSATACWFVGAGGTIVAADGDRWRIVAAPAPGVDLVSILALDRLNATVRTVDGRTFRTSDGGASWSLQENPPAPFSK